MEHASEGVIKMEKKNIDWSNLSFGYIQTENRFVSNYRKGAWDAGIITSDATVRYQRMRRSPSLCANVLRGPESLYDRRRSHRYLSARPERRTHDGIG